jgi:hypothetical protein
VSDATNDEVQPTTNNVTLEQIIGELEPGIEDAYDLVVQLGRDGMLQADGEIRRGLIGMNGAGLLAVISLLSQSLTLAAVKIAAILYFAGLLFGCVSWLQRSRSSQMAFYSKHVYKSVFKKIGSDPVGKIPLKTREDLEAAGLLLHNVVESVSSKLKAPGKNVPFLSYFAFGVFILATLIMVVDFEVCPRATSPTAIFSR